MLLGSSWPTGSQIAMHLQLDRPIVQLQDGSLSWNASAADALGIWNQYLDKVQFVQAEPTSASAGDGANSVFFSNTIYGDTFGASVLAVTLNYSQQGSGVFTETDVIVNNNRKWNSYRGPIQGAGTNATWDFHRVALHEFGHVLGLDHPDEHGQNVTALMNSIISDLDHLADDDISGVVFLYSYRITSSLNSSTTLGNNFTYQIGANNAPTSFFATGLPPGLMLDPTTGIITGVPTISGIYAVTITAAGVRTVSATVRFQVVIPEQLTLLKGISTGHELAGQLVADPQLPRMYGVLPLSDSIMAVDLESRSIIKTIPVGRRPRGLAIGADGKKLWVANSESTNAELSVIDLATLEKLPSVFLPLPYYSIPYSIVAGANSKLYIATTNSDIVEVDSNTGAYLGSFRPSATLYHSRLAVSPDATVLFTNDVDVSPASIMRLTLSGTSGVRTTTIPASGMQLSSDGMFLYTYLTPASPNSTGFAKLNASDLSTVHLFSDLRDYGSLALSGDDATIYRAHMENNAVGWIDVIDTTSYRLLSSLRMAENTFVSNFYGNLCVDVTGAYLAFASRYASSSYDPNNPTGDYGQLRIFSTGRPNIPKRAVVPKTLVNISTRVPVGLGDDVAIAGFILRGNDAQKVILRAIAPSLHLPGGLSDPVLELHDASGAMIGSNDNWNSHRADVLSTGVAPTDEHESAIVATLEPGSYTAVLRGVQNSMGVALVEVYGLASNASKIANISTRGQVDTGDNVMIGGFIIAGDQSTNVTVRAIGPSLAKSGVGGSLADPTLELHDGNGGLVTQNDDWRRSQEQPLIDSGLAPTDDRESAMILQLQPGSYTAIVRGKDSTTGVGLVEVYNLDAN